MIMVYKYLKVVNSKKGKELQGRVHKGITRSNGRKLRKEYFKMNISKIFLTVKSISLWKSFPKEVGKVSLFETLKTGIDKNKS